MDIGVQKEGDAVVLSPEGDVDLSTSKDLQHHLKQALQGKPVRVLIDLSRVSYMDSSGVATLVEAMQISRRQSTRLVLCSMQQRVKSVFEIARLDRVFEIAENVEVAGDSCSG